MLEKSPFSMGMGFLSRYWYEQQISVGLLVCAGFASGSASPRLLQGLVLGPGAALAVQALMSPLGDGICFTNTFISMMQVRVSRMGEGIVSALLGRK